MHYARFVWVLPFCAVMGLVVSARNGVGQVPSDDGPDLLLTSSTDYGSLRSALENLQSLSESSTSNIWIEDLRFRKILEVGSDQVYSGSFVRYELPHMLSLTGVDPTTLIRSNRAFAYIHQVGQPCAVPPDSVFEGVTTDKGSRGRFVSSKAIHLGIELDFLVTVLQQIETGDPQLLLGPLASYADAGSSMALVDVEADHDGSFVELSLEYEDLQDPNAPRTVHTVSGVFGLSGFEQLSVQ